MQDTVTPQSCQQAEMSGVRILIFIDDEGPVLTANGLKNVEPALQICCAFFIVISKHEGP